MSGRVRFLSRSLLVGESAIFKSEANRKKRGDDE